MENILYHKNLPVLSFETDEDFYITNINDIFSESHVPIGILNSYAEKPLSAFSSWWRNRSIPASRRFLREALEILHVRSSQDLLTKCHGLSLSDHYWVNTESRNRSDIRWEDINFFTNEFTEDIGKVLTGNFGLVDIGSISFVSPDATTDGWLPKKWIIDNNERFLVKGGSETFQQEPFNEVIASSIYRKLFLPHVSYSLTSHQKDKQLQFFSVCKNMVSEQTELVPAYSIFKTARQKNNIDSLSLFFQSCSDNGIQDIDTVKKQFSRMSAVDFILANTDRHLNNFGFLRDPDTLEWLGMAPIYDNGTSLFCKYSAAQLRNPDNIDSDYVETKPFAKSLRLQFDKIRKVCGTEILDLSLLNGIDDEWYELINTNPLCEGRAELLKKILAERIRETERIFEHPDIHRNKHKSNQNWER